MAASPAARRAERARPIGTAAQLDQLGSLPPNDSPPAVERPRLGGLNPDLPIQATSPAGWIAAPTLPRATAPATILPNRTGLPDRLKTGIESLSGQAMDDVRVHFNSPRPARIGALAYAQGADIHLGPGQARHLPHEAWHVVQQRRGRVPPTMRTAGVAINDHPGLEAEAAAMGARAADHRATTMPEQLADAPAAGGVAQLVGQIRFANLSPDQKYASKGQSIIAGLRATPSIMHFLRNKDVLITLEPEPQLASVRTIGDQVQISLAPWFFEQESRGRILGMLAHEFGVHPLARDAMTAPELAQETADLNTAFPTGIPHHTVTAAAAGQQDHIFAAVAGQPRFRVYRQTVHEMALGMLATAQGINPGGLTQAHVTDLIMTYLSDIAMILATNDHRGQIITQPGRTAAAFNSERQRWIAWLGANNTPADNQLIALTPGPKTGQNVLGEVKSIAGSRALSFMWGWNKPTSDFNMSHRALGVGVAPANRVQEGVLADHGLQLMAAQTASDSIYRALAVAGVAGARATLAHFLNHVAAPGAVTTRVLALVQSTADLRTELDSQALHAFALGLNRKLRILQPSGKMMEGGRDTDPLLTLVWVRQPTPHYRAAQPIPPVVHPPPVLPPPVLPLPHAVAVHRPRTRSLGGGPGAPRPGHRPRVGSF